VKSNIPCASYKKKHGISLNMKTWF